MTGLISKWATDEALVAAALEQDKRAKPSVPSTKPPVAPPKANKLVSKWADAPDPEPTIKTSPKRGNTQLHTPPSSAGNGGRRDRNERRKSEGKSDRGSFGHERRNSRGNSGNSDFSGSSKGMSADQGRSLASRLGSMDLSNTHSNQSSGEPKKSHAGRGFRAPARSPDKNGHYSSASASFKQESDEENERGPMTAAAKSFASRLGVPTEDATSPKKSYNSSHQVNNATRPSTSSKYMTPKQKRALEQQEKKAQLTKEQELKEAKLKEEVKHLFEKMSDKSTSWADLEDESD